MSKIQMVVVDGIRYRPEDAPKAEKPAKTADSKPKTGARTTTKPKK